MATLWNAYSNSLEFFFFINNILTWSIIIPIAILFQLHEESFSHGNTVFVYQNLI